MRRVLISLCIIVPIILGSYYPAQKRPNIIIIMADDMGYSDIGCFGSEIHTPNLDMLAKNGLRITQFYNASRCCPTRASLLTGLYQHQAGIGEMVNDRHLPGYRGFLTDSCVTIAEVLRQAGYRTYMTGKWHVGERRPHWPLDRGFDRYFGLINGATSHFQILNYRPNSRITLALNNDSVAAPADYYSSDAFTDYALRFLDEDKNSKKPFFLYLAFQAPHWPLHARAADIAKYKDRYAGGWDKVRAERFEQMKQLGILDNQARLSPTPPRMGNWDTIAEKQKLNWQDKMAVYAAMIDRMDQNIGRLLHKLNQLGADKNTLIIFLSDNGGSPETITGPGFNTEILAAAQKAASDPSSFTSYELPGAVVSNTPFRMYKAYVHEGGVSTPFIAWFPSMIKAGQIKAGPALIIDLMPTCVDLAGAKYRQTFGANLIQPMEGISLVPLFRGKNWKGHDAIFFEHFGRCAVRMGDWKIVLNMRKNWELYNIKEDRSELNDLSNEYPDKLKILRAAYESWAERTRVIPFEKRQQQQADE
jgi:arylsulfatase